MPPPAGSRPEALPAVHHDETTPLLATQPVVPATDPDVPRAETQSTDEHDRPLPVTQILLLCYARMIEPIAYFAIFPFISEMVQRNGQLAVGDVGFYAGLIESLFSLTQMAVMVFWGRAADRFGRKPVLIVSLAGVTVASALFGFAQTIPQMVIFRCLAGVFGGVIVTIRTMISEHSTSKTQARAFSWFAFANNMGMFVGPLLGGALADPAKQYGGVFKDVAFFEEYPYALPVLVTASFGASALLVVIPFVHETLDVAATKDTATASPSIMDVLKAPGVGMVLWLYSHVMFLAFTYTAIVPVFWYTPIDMGGFGWSELLKSIYMGLTGASQAIWLLIIFPPLQRHFGTGGIMRGCANAYPAFFLVLPALNLLLRQHTDAARVTFWIVGTTCLVVGVGVSMSFTAVQLALNDVSPSPQTLGTLNAVALTLISGVRAFSPVVATSIFAIGVRNQILMGYLVWIVLFVAAAAFTVATRWLPPNAEGKVRDD